MVQGGNFFKKAWKGIKKANSWLRDTKVISKVSQHIPGIGDKIYKVSSALGYGCVSTPRYVKGRGWIKNTFNKIKGWNSKLKDKKYISRYSRLAAQTLDDLGKMSGNQYIQNAAKFTDKVTGSAKALGYGRGGKRLKMNGGRRLVINGGSADQMRTLQLCKMKSKLM